MWNDAFWTISWWHQAFWPGGGKEPGPPLQKPDPAIFNGLAWTAGPCPMDWTVIKTPMEFTV